MPMELQGSRTQANLMAAFSGESMARTKYDLFAGAAKKEGYVHIANVFLRNGQQRAGARQDLV